MAKKQIKQGSKFFATFRLKPERSFTALRAKLTTGDGYEISFHDDMVWIGFDATQDEWLHRLEVGKQALRILLAILTMQTEYPFNLEPIQWIEDKPRDKSGQANYILGRMGPDLVVQNESPYIRIEPPDYRSRSMVKRLFINQ